MRLFLVLLFFLAFNFTNAQGNFKRFLKLSGPKKYWVIFHPFKAKRALQVSLEAKITADSIKRTNLLDGDAAGGKVDTFRHAYWMARLHQKIGKRAARSLGKAHEKENYKTFKRGNLEEGFLPDKIATEMDLWNNEQGLLLADKRSTITKKKLIYSVIEAITNGAMRIVKKDRIGNFLTCNGEIISKKEILGKWENNKCLIASNLN